MKYQPGGIFGPEWWRWRGATLEVALTGEVPFVARLDAVEPAKLKPGWGRIATLTVLDGAGRPRFVRLLPWPPEGTVRVVRTP